MAGGDSLAGGTTRAPACGSREGDHEEAVLLFTSGSSGDPKGVILSHRNLVGNVSQFRIVLEATKDDLILASLPFFHSFGCTVTLWFPLIDGVRVVTYPNPLEAAKCAELIEQLSGNGRARGPDFSARLFAQSKAGTTRNCSPNDDGRRKTPAASRGDL